MLQRAGRLSIENGANAWYYIDTEKRNDKNENKHKTQGGNQNDYIMDLHRSKHRDRSCSNLRVLQTYHKNLNSKGEINMREIHYQSAEDVFQGRKPYYRFSF